MKKTIAALAILLLSLATLVGCNDETNPTELTRVFFLESATDYERATKLSSITLHDNGEVEFTQALISSFMLPPSYANFVYDGWHQVRIYSIFDENEPIAIFEFADDENTLILREASVPLFVDIGTRYVYQRLIQ